jgi:hypothetical protein
MTDVSPPFAIPMPDEWRNSPGEVTYYNALLRHLNEMFERSGAGTDTVGDTAATVLTQGEKLDLITVTQTVDLDSIETIVTADTATLAAIATGSPTYAPSNDATDRTWDANAAAGAISSPPTQAEVENIRDAVLELSDVVATLARDLATKGIIGT